LEAQARAQTALKVGTARLSIISNSALVLMKLAAGLYMGSVSVISEALHSLVDLLAAVAAFLSVRVSGRPADIRHPFGHGKFESMAGMFEGALIVLAAAGILYASIRRIMAGEWALREPLLGAAVMVFSAVANVIVSRRLFKVGEETDSIALQADAWHLRTDVYTTLGVLVAMVGIRVGRWVGLPLIELLDPLAAIAVALIIINAGWGISRKSFEHLADEVLPAQEQEAVKRLLQEHYAQFVEYHELRTRKAGPERHIDLHLSLPASMPVSEAHEVCDHLEADIRNLVPGAQVLIHVEPVRPAPRRPGESAR